MVTPADIEKWNPDKLLAVIGTAESAHKSLEKLGENYDGTKRSLSDWGGLTAEAWKAQHGKLRTDIAEQGRQAKAVADAMKPLYDEVLAVKREYQDIKGTVERNASFDSSGTTVHWKLNPNGTINTGGASLDYQSAMVKQDLEQRMQNVLARATTVDADIANALRAITSGGMPTIGGQVPADKPKDEPKPAPQDPSMLASGPVGGPDGNPPYPNGATPTMIPGKTIPMADNSPGWDQNMAPGPQRDQAWKDYLSGKNPDGSQRAPGTPPLALPKPEAVSDKGLRVIGAAGRQQGVSYAWGGNKSVGGPTQGTLAGDPPDGGAHRYHDDQRTGFDCGGLVRYSTQQGAGYDVFQRADGLDSGAGTDRIDKSQHLTPVSGGARIPSGKISSIAQSGDILVFETPGSGHEAFSGNNTQHTGIYVGNGYMINAPESGKPVRLDNADEDSRMTDVLRLK